MTGIEGLYELIRQRKTEVEQAGNRKKMLKEWLATLRNLSVEIQSWLFRDPSKEELLTTRLEASYKISEPLLGTYDVEDLVIVVPPTGHEVRVRPVGRHVAGAEGRVDVECGPRRAVLVRSPHHIGKVRRDACRRAFDSWYFASLPPTVLEPEYIELTEDTFAETLREPIS
ncbi:MAG: hypothetical protein HYY93_03980 [Planctomycetes bacterium]|nr:hypothetical protein [Planctomycetota bacterium]